MYVVIEYGFSSGTYIHYVKRIIGPFTKGNAEDFVLKHFDEGTFDYKKLEDES